MKAATISSLSLMMFLEYFIWSSWYVTMGTYMSVHLNASGLQIGAAYSALAIATMISPFLVGMVADKYFAAQKVMGVLHLLGAVVLYFTTRVESNVVFYWVVLAYSILYMPTIALSNSIAFNVMNNPGRQFPVIRVFGTVGWIAAGLLVGFYSLEQTTAPFYISAVGSALLGLYSFFLPHTPPKANGATTNVVDPGTVSLLRNRQYLIFFVSAILICIPLAFYYGFASVYLTEKGVDNVAGKMILGQVSEAIFILAIPFLFTRIGVKNMLILGMAAWVLRYIAFGYGNTEDYYWLIYTGIILHGICYDFFFVTGYMYTEKTARPENKNAAQGLFTFATYGLGMFIGTWFSGIMVDKYKTGDLHNWLNIWLVPTYIAAAVLLLFIIFFRDQRDGRK